MNPVADGECQLADPCLECSSGTGHPPVLAFYDPAEGGYLIQPGEEEFCIARWASAGPRGHNAGDLCGEPAEEWAGDIPLCAHHFKRQVRWWEDKSRREWGEIFENQERLLEQQMRNDEKRHKRQLEMTEERIAAEAVAKSRHSVVYYIRRLSDGAVKIGFTTSLDDRMATLRGQHGPLEILLVLGGDRVEEGEAHGKFREFRLGRTEWFCPARPVLEWICEARREHSHPHIQPEGILSLPKLKKLAAAAPDRGKLEWTDSGTAQWPPRAVA